MVIKDGRFGPYVTDGETNASLRKGDDVLSITDERAAELLADRRARGPVKRAAKKTAKKAGAKKAPPSAPVKRCRPHFNHIRVATYVARSQAMPCESGPALRVPRAPSAQ